MLMGKKITQDSSRENSLLNYVLIFQFPPWEKASRSDQVDAGGAAPVSSLLTQGPHSGCTLHPE